MHQEGKREERFVKLPSEVRSPPLWLLSVTSFLCVIFVQASEDVTKNLQHIKAILYGDGGESIANNHLPK